MVFFAFKPSRFLVSLVEKSFIVLSESPGSLHVVRENVKQDHRKNFRAAAHEELPQTVISRLCVDAFSGRCSLLVDLFALLGVHSGSPFGDRGAVGAAWVGGVSV